MKKIMISQPMNGLTDEQIDETRNRFFEFACKEKFDVVNTFFTGGFNSPSSMKSRGIIQIPVYFLAKSLEYMSECTTVYFAKGWENARGCKIEHEVALQYGLDVIYEANELNE
jgi:hypothetical protein